MFRLPFTSSSVNACATNKNPGASLETLYKQKVGRGLNKKKLAETLVEEMLSRSAKRKIDDRPIVKTLERVERLALRNPFPTMQQIWERNQASKYLGKKRKAG